MTRRALSRPPRTTLLGSLALLMMLAACGGGGDGGSGPGRVLLVTPTTVDLADCGTSQLVVELQDGDGNPVPGATYAFSTNAGTVASVSALGLVTATGPGSATIVVSSAGQIVNVPVTVTAVAPVPLGVVPDSVTLWPTIADTLLVGFQDCRGDPVGSLISLTSSAPGVVIAAGNVLAGQAHGTATISWVLGAANGQFNVRVIGRSLGTSMVSTPVPNGPYGLALTPTGRLLVTQISSTTLATGQLPGTAITPAVAVGTTPPHVVVNPQGTLAFVTNQTSGTVSIVNLAADQTTGTVPLGGAGFNLLMTRDGNEVFVTTDNGLVYRLDATGAKVDSFTVGPIANGLVEHPTLPLVYISARDGQSVTVFDRQLNVAVDTFITGGMPQRLAISLDGEELFIGNETLGLDIWSTSTGQRITTVPMPAYGLAISPDGTQLCVTSAAGTVRLVDVATRIARTITIGGNNRNAIYDASGRTAIVTDQFDAVHFIR